MDECGYGNGVISRRFVEVIIFELFLNVWRTRRTGRSGRTGRTGQDEPGQPIGNGQAWHILANLHFFAGVAKDAQARSRGSAALSDGSAHRGGHRRLRDKGGRCVRDASERDIGLCRICRPRLPAGDVGHVEADPAIRGGGRMVPLASQFWLLALKHRYQYSGRDIFI